MFTMKHYSVKYLSIFSSTLMVLAVGSSFSGASMASTNEYLDMDIAQLMQVTITSVAKKPQNLSDTAAAVFVITQDDIHRSGVTSIPEALRMAPGLQVSRIDANKWAITSRGLTGNFANELLVMIDGRTVYSPTFSGVYWDAQNTLLDDVERIEVIRGPGATVWGANAVNGVVNIITKKAGETQGGLAYVGGGDREPFLGGVRYGMELGESAHGRVYLTYNKTDSSELYHSGDDAGDDWDSLRGGFRLDGTQGGDSAWTLQGDIYSNKINQLVDPLWLPNPPFMFRQFEELDESGGNILGRWQKDISATDQLTVQLYYDYTNRDEFIIEQTHKTFDFDLNYHRLLGERNDLTMGVGYRMIHADFGNTFQVKFDPDKRTDSLYSAFLQDEIMLVENSLWLTLGTKWENNVFTGNEIQPSARLLWKMTEKQRVWAAVSRAVRTPSQAEASGEIVIGVIPAPTGVQLMKLRGSEDFDSEVLIAYETGYRWIARDNLSLDLAVYYDDYDKLQATDRYFSETGAGIEFVNKMHGGIYGFELSSDWNPADWLGFKLGYTYIQFDLTDDTKLHSSDYSTTISGLSPEHQLSLRSLLEFTDDIRGNLWLRYVDKLTETIRPASQGGVAVEDYLTMDVTLSWQATKHMELMLVGQNLLDPGHLEYVSEFSTEPTERPRSFYAKLTYQF